MRGTAAVAVLVALAMGGGLAHAQEPAPPGGSLSTLHQVSEGPIQWQRSVPAGTPNGGFLIRGVQLPAQGEDWFTWDPILDRFPNRGWRRWATDDTVRTLLQVIHRFRMDHPGAARLGIADMSRTQGGPFGSKFGGLGHASHQNGRDVDIYYPRTDRHERSVHSVSEIDHALAADLVRRFVKAGAQYVFVGPHTGLAPGGRQFGRRVQRLVYHDDHMHVRFGGGGGGG